MKNTATILIVDDDPNMVTGLRDNLEIEGHQVVTASSLRTAQAAITAQRLDLILLDVMLPDGDGVSFCRQLRQAGETMPIIMLTAKGQEMDKVVGLEVGADDYVVKPFALRELLARVKAQLRRTAVKSAAMATEMQIGAAQVDFKRHRLVRDGEVLETSAKEFDLLKYLVEHRGQVVSRDTLLQDVWGHQREIATRTVDNFIVRLRKKIEINASEPRYLLTVHGSGYKLVEQ